VERDVLLRRYGKKRQPAVRRRDLLEDNSQWSLDASGANKTNASHSAEDVASELPVDPADAEATKRHQRFAAQRKQQTEGERTERENTRERVTRTGRARPSADLTGSIPPPGDTEVFTEEFSAEAEDEELIDDRILDSDGEEPPIIPRGQVLRQQMATRALSELNNVWQNLRIDVQRKLALTDKYTKMQSEREPHDPEADGPQARAVQKLVQAEKLWKHTDQAVTRRERALQQLTHRLDPGMPGYDPSFADDQQAVTAALQALAKTGLDVEQAADRLKHVLQDELTWDGTHVAERLRTDYLSVISLVEQAKAAVPTRQNKAKTPRAGESPRGR